MTSARADGMRFDLRWLGSALRTVFDLVTPRHGHWAPGECRHGITRRTTGTLSCLSAGDPQGRRVIFIHGSPSEAEDWSHLLKEVPAGLEFVAVDRPGFGWSGPDAAPTELDEQAAALAPLLEERAGRKPILVGYSLGGPIAARAAADFGGAVGGLLIVGGALDAELERVHPLQRVAAWRWVARCLPRSLRNANRELLALKGQLPGLAARLGGIRVPVTLLHGTKDPLVPYANMAFTAERLTGSRLVRCVPVPDADHFLPWSHAALLRDAVTDLARLADRAERARQYA
ncbi:alpha/beta hydrolase [Azospirillum sp.]|uniref:alpha/beta fold hydrolase n=1 Tax=Azospirillum sp. TaxID=34012 RepID=UPI002D4168E3|nr:alpha/beta hydrolase [Azospirillum sp.]HYD64119.1 alpha/beta hydrolase [Azospirillum sp.]